MPEGTGVGGVETVAGGIAPAACGSQRLPGKTPGITSLGMVDISPDETSLRRLLVTALDAALPRVGQQPKEVSVLDLACGECREVEIVSSVAAAKLGMKGTALRFVGADIRGAQIDNARARARALRRAGASVEFLEQDCSRLKDLKELGRNFDMVFLRHQNFWNDRRAWRRIFSQGMERLSDSGLLVITSYFDGEHELAVKAIRQAGGDLLTSIRNRDSRALPTAGKSVDRHLAVFRKAPGK